MRGCRGPISSQPQPNMYSTRDANRFTRDIPGPRPSCQAQGSPSPPPGFFKDLDQELQQHQERRQQAVLAEHLSRMEIRPVLTDLPQLPAVPMAGDCSPDVAAQPGKEAAPRATSSTQTSSSTKKPVPKSQKSSVPARKGAPAATASKTSPGAAPSMTKTTAKRNTK